MKAVVLHPPAFDQRSEAWAAIRAGRITASRLADVMNMTLKGEPGSKRKQYLAELIFERITGQAAPSVQTWAMRRGSALEPQGKAEYEFTTGLSVVGVGFIPHPTIPMAGASPDGLVGEDGLMELKCPEIHTHLTTKLTGAGIETYRDQMQWQMACTERLWCDFVSFHDALPFPANIHIERVPRDEARIADLEAAVRSLDAEVDACVAKIMGAGL